MPKERADAQPWEAALRRAIKTQHKWGYSVRPMRGKVQVERYWKDTGKRQAATLPIEWRRGCEREVLNALHGINAAIAKGLSLKDAVRLTFDLTAGPKVQTNWREIYSRFYDFKVPAKVKETTWEKEYAPRLLWLIDVLTGADAPNNAELALAAMRAGRNGQGDAPGSRSRKLRIQYAVQMLRFAVSKCGASGRWLPPDEDTIRDLIGEPAPNSSKASQSGQALALSDEQFLRLFDSITNARWKLAVGLIGVFGLRGVELKYATAHRDHLHVSYGKRTAKGSTEARDAPILDPAGRAGLGQQLLMTLSSGITELPPLGSTDKAASGAIDTFLRRNDVWMEYKADAKAMGQRVSLYSLRHCFADRCAMATPPIPPKAAAVAMGHSLQVHLQTYQRQHSLKLVKEAFETSNTSKVAI